jgi:LmbE family N-acetylglucosaminyl deacetylase
MYDTEIALDREFMRRMIRAYEQDLLQLVDEDDPHPDHARIMEHLDILALLRSQTFSRFQQTITF